MTTPTTVKTESLFERLRTHSKTVAIDGEKYWRVEGDLLLDEDQLLLYAQRREAEQNARAALQKAGLPLVGMVELVGMTETGKIVRWAPDVELSYTVLRKTFTLGGDAGYQLVLESLRTATADWENTCGVRFAYRAELDGSDTVAPEGALFVVREFNAGGQFIAASFFPTDPLNRRRLLVDPSFYSPALSFNKAGVLRHELGHILGFRHEHIRSGKPPGCPDEDTYGTINFTDYDPVSVMHYFCGGLGSTELAISEKDRTAARQVYGMPLSGFYFAH